MRRRFLLGSPVFLFLLSVISTLVAQSDVWEGEWITDMGKMELTQDGVNVRGSYSESGTITGSADKEELKLTFENGNSSGEATFKFDDESGAFGGTWKTGGSSGSWNGWKIDPQAVDAATADFSGVWMSSWGTLQLKQEGDKVTGSYGAEGWSTIEGTVEGRRLNLKWKRIQWSGGAWLEQSKDGKRLFGISTGDNDPTIWTGLKIDEFEYDVKPKAGEIVQGVAKNGMLYHLRMPDGWVEGDKADLVVLLHGSNWTTAGMVFVTGKNWPKVGKKFAILGIQGQSWAKWSKADDLRFNYTYVNWMGRSTYEGYPFTDRESPYLVMKVIGELKETHSFDRVFVGGHSQGGYLTFILHMHYADQIAGTFPIAGGMVMQAEPDVFDDKDLVKAQKETPMAIVHGKKDNVVGYSSGVYNFNRFLAHNFPNVKFFNPNGGHPYDFLPIGDAIEWLDMMTTNNSNELADYAKQQLEEKNWREVGAAIQRAKDIGAGKEFSPIWKAFEAAAKVDSEKYLESIKTNRNSKWVKGFLIWHEEFFSADAAKEINDLFFELQDEHDELAKELMKEARKAFNAGKRNEGYAKYEEIINKAYASKKYRTVKATLDKRKN